jgi:maltooligosyltrehalose trehalohydrolase
MLFMGEEYADQSPFYYFVSHSDKDLIKAVQQGRAKEFEDFGFDENIPDPQDENTFIQCKLDWEKRNQEEHKIILNWHKELIGMRNTLAPLKNFQKTSVRAGVISEKAFFISRNSAGMEDSLICLFNFSDKEIVYTVSSTRTHTKLIDSKEGQWQYMNTNSQLHPKEIKPDKPIALQPSSIVVYSSGNL